ncbi:TolC family protein [Ferribacterium limneticum]|nr:TolC family protein [Ferribacterium limneticum]UCV17825.1 TolC family protein [Ferribacterium limneticum]
MLAEHALKAANANIGTARAAFFPMISLTALAGFASPALSGLFDSDSRTWPFVPSITVPIFDAGRNQANLDASKANREIAVARYEKAIQGALREVSDGLIARGTLLSQVEAQSALVEAADSSLRLSDSHYRQGIDSYLVVLDAERSLYSAQQELIQLQVQLLSNLVTLYKVMVEDGHDIPDCRAVLSILLHEPVLARAPYICILIARKHYSKLPWNNCLTGLSPYNGHSSQSQQGSRNTVVRANLFLVAGIWSNRPHMLAEIDGVRIPHLPGDDEINA